LTPKAQPPNGLGRRLRQATLLLALDVAAVGIATLAAPPPEHPDAAVGTAQARLAWMREHQTGMWNVAPNEGAFLRDEIVKLNLKRALEIGTSNGYSGTWIALGLRKTGEAVRRAARNPEPARTV
jgi:predicted O-methyltransferase YrrM